MQQKKLQRRLMHQQRDPHTSYRVEVSWPVKSDQLTFLLTIYPPVGSGYGSTVRCEYREDVIPEWMRTAIDMLDMAAFKGEATIPFFGSKSGNTYWFFAKQVYETEAKL